MRLGFQDEGQVYIVPLNYGYILEGDQYTFYFHGAKEGRKIDLIRKNPQVGFEMDCNIQIREADTACSCSAGFQSIIGNGCVSIVEDASEKKKGLSAIMKKNTSKDQWDIPESGVDAVCVFKMVVEHLSCKVHE